MEAIQSPAIRCTRCGVLKPHEDFAPSTSKANGRESWCRVCRTAAVALQRAEHPEKNRESVRRYEQRKRARLVYLEEQCQRYAAALEQARAESARLMATLVQIKQDPEGFGHCGACIRKRNAAISAIEAAEQARGEDEVSAREVCPRCFSPSCVCSDADVRDEPEPYSTRAWRAEAEVERLTDELKTVCLDRAAVRAELEQARAELGEMTGERNRYCGLEASVRQERDQARAESGRLKDELEQTRTDYDRLRQKTYAESARLLRQREAICEETREFVKDYGANRRLIGDCAYFFDWTEQRIFAFRDRVAALASDEVTP